MFPERSVPANLLFAMLYVVGCAARPAQGPYVVDVDLTATIRALGSDDLFASDPAMDRIISVGPRVIPALEQALSREPAAVRAGVVDALSRMPVPESLPPLMRAAAEDDDEEVRYAALQSLAVRGDQRAMGVVEAALDDPSLKIHLAAASACASLCSSPAALTLLVHNTLHDPPWPNFVAGRTALAAILTGTDLDRARQARGAIETAALPVIAAGRSAGESARAALLASDIGSDSGAKILAGLVGDTRNPMLRLHAIYALGKVGRPPAVAPLAAQLDDPAVAVYVYDALSRLAERGAPGARRALAAFTGRRPQQSLPPPYRLLH